MSGITYIVHGTIKVITSTNSGSEKCETMTQVGGYREAYAAAPLVHELAAHFAAARGDGEQA